MPYIWDNRILFEKYRPMLENFLYAKLGINIDLTQVIRKHMFSRLKKELKSPSKKLPSSPSKKLPKVSDDDNYYGWTIIDAFHLFLLQKIEYSTTMKHATLKDIGCSILFNIKHQFKHFKYLNITSEKSYLFDTICNLLEIPHQTNFNLTPGQFMRTPAPFSYISLITIFMGACRFYDIDMIFTQLYNICCDGGYLLIKEYDLKCDDKVHLYNTYYDIYRALCDNEPIDKMVREKKRTNYKSCEEWINYISQFGFTYVARHTQPPSDEIFDNDRIYLLFQKSPF